MRGNYEAKDSNSLCCNKSLKNRAFSKTAHKQHNAKFRIMLRIRSQGFCNREEKLAICPNY